MQQEVTRFEDLYSRYAPAIHRFVFRLSGGDAATADDITSETFLRVWTARDRVRLATVQAYLFAIARNLYLEGLRRERKQAPLDEAAAAVAPAQPGRRGDIERALNALPEADRAALVLRLEEDLPYEEIAGVLGITAAAARVKVHRARMKVAQALGGKEAFR
ncbi:MAG: sigma-70 family RNA polymerase sigma factor [Bryobacteraceae bacterium]|nr:sigma-70 family RNA polymerase sigma factor [Bryobacteraceae bacterium]